MNHVFDFAGVAVAIAASVGLALWLEWLTLRGLMRLMPAPRLRLSSARIAPVAIDGEHQAEAA